MAASATPHCLTGCAIGEVPGMVIGTWLGLHDNKRMIGRGRRHAVVHAHHHQVVEYGPKISRIYVPEIRLDQVLPDAEVARWLIKAGTGR